MHELEKELKIKEKEMHNYVTRTRENEN